MRIRVGCEFVWETITPVPMLMLVRPRADADHIAVYESTWSEPQLPIHEYTDLYGNNCWRFLAPPGSSAVRYDAVVEIPETPDPVVPDAALHRVEDLPDDAIVFTLPSRYVESDKLLDVAWELFGNTAPTWERIQAVCDWVHHNIEFVNGSSTPATTAWDIYQQRKGVCRDFALLSVALCRALNIPARYTFGYLPDIAIEPPDVPMDFHTWFEAYVGGRWYTFDARHNTPRVGRVVIGRGRDAVDCALSTSYGSARLAKFTVWSDEITAERPGGPPQEEDADSAEAAERAEP
ncbi:MAG: transglutaminase family protein [Chloroflexota bacterium]|nr:transglutaminase family protein [Chloroflexota bacterium]